MRTGIFHFDVAGNKQDFEKVSEAKKVIEQYLLAPFDNEKQVLLYRNNVKYGMYWIDDHTGRLSGVRFKNE